MKLEYIKHEIESLDAGINIFADLFLYDWCRTEIDEYGFMISFYNSPVRKSFDVHIKFGEGSADYDDIFDAIIVAYMLRLNQFINESFEVQKGVII